MFNFLNKFGFSCCLEEGAGGSGGGTGGGAPVPVTFETVTALEGDSFSALIPQDFKDKPYLKDVKRWPDVFKKLDGAESLLGQRHIPTAEDTPERWDEFHAKTRPGKAEDYPLPTQIDGVPAGYLESIQKEGVLPQLFFASDLSKRQGAKLANSLIKSMYAAEQAEGKAKDESFNKMMGDVFGQSKDAVIQNGKQYLAAHLPDTVRPFLNDLGDKEMALVLAFTDVMAKKFTGEDPFRGSGSGSGGSGVRNKDAVVSDMQKIMQNPAYADPFKDRNTNKALMDQMEKLREELRKYV